MDHLRQLQDHMEEVIICEKHLIEIISRKPQFIGFEK